MHNFDFEVADNFKSSISKQEVGDNLAVWVLNLQIV